MGLARVQTNRKNAVRDPNEIPKQETVMKAIAKPEPRLPKAMKAVR